MKIKVRQKSWSIIFIESSSYAYPLLKLKEIIKYVVLYI